MRTAGSVGRMWWAWLLAAGLLAVVRVEEPSALSCAPVPLAKEVREAAAILEATVASVTVHPQVATHHPDGTVSSVAAPRRATVQLSDVFVIRGRAVSTLESDEHVFHEGRRYLIVAKAIPSRPGQLVAGGCAGHVRPAVRSEGFRDWMASLARPHTGGQILGSVIEPVVGTNDVSVWPGVAGARVRARGPVTVEAIAAHDGQFVLADLPDGEYEVTVAVPEHRHDLLAPDPSRAVLKGEHAVWSADLRVQVDGTITGRVVDSKGSPVANASVFMHVQQDTGPARETVFGLGRTSPAGEYAFRGVPPGTYTVTLDQPYAPTYARSLGGVEELVLGWAERLELAPMVAARRADVQVSGTVVDTAGRPVEMPFHVAVLGPRGPYPGSGSWAASDASGRFRLRLTPGMRYRFTIVDYVDDIFVLHDVLVDGSPISLVLRP